MQEPRDGDFVAYIDALQRESAARLARQHLGVADPTFQSTSAEPRTDGQARWPSSAPSSDSTAAGGRRDERLAKPLVAAVIGAASLLSWLGGGGPFSFIIGVALLAYAAPRILAAFRKQARAPDNRAAIDHVFGRSGAPTTGTKR